MRLLILPACIGLAACAAPDLTSELEAFSKGAKAANTDLVAYAAPRAAAEQTRARQARLKQGRSPIKVNCQVATPLDECVIEETSAPPVDDRLWTNTLKFSVALAGYLDAFENLANADTPTQIGARTTALFQTLASFSDIPTASGARLVTGRASALASPLGALAQQAAGARKYRALRHAAEPVDTALNRAFQALNTEGVFPASDRAFKTLAAAARALEANKTPTAADVRDVERKREAYLAAVRATPLEQVRLMRVAHAQLLSALKRNATPKEVLDLITKLKDLNSALKET